MDRHLLTYQATDVSVRLGEETHSQGWGGGRQLLTNHACHLRGAGAGGRRAGLGGGRPDQVGTAVGGVVTVAVAAPHLAALLALSTRH